jgi:hypothetical protein
MLSINLTWITMPSPRLWTFCFFDSNRTPIPANIRVAWSVAAIRTKFGTMICPVINNVTSAPRTALAKRRITQMRFTRTLLSGAGWTEFEGSRRVSPDAFEEMKDTT